MSPEQKPEATWWQRRSGMEKKLVILAIGIAAIFLLALIVIAGVYFGLRTDICTTPGCVRASLEILDRFDPSLDPCHDFYEFACKKYLNETILDGKNSRTTDDDARKEVNTRLRIILEKDTSVSYEPDLIAAKKFYRACKNETARDYEGLNMIKQIFKYIGGWPLLDIYWHADPFQWMSAIHRLRQRGINFEMFFVISVVEETDKEDEYVLMIDSPSFTKSDIDRIPLEYMVDMAVAFGADRSTAFKEQKEVLELSRQLAEYIERSHALYTSRSDPPRLTIRKLRETYPGVDWKYYINGVLGTNFNISESDEVLVANQHYLEYVHAIFKGTPKRALANFISWYALQYVLHYLPINMHDKVYHFIDISRPPRWENCLAETQKRFSLTLYAAYAEETYDGTDRVRSMEMIREIKEQFRRKIGELSWMDETTKRRTREQLGTSTEDIVSPQEIRSALSRENVFQTINIDENKYFETVLRIDQQMLNLQYGKLKQRARNSLWSCQKFPTDFYISYSPQQNTFKIPVGLLRSPFFSRDRPNYLNYAGLGSISARKYAQVFGTNENRKLNPWSSSTVHGYDRRAQCVARLYEKFHVPEMKQIGSTEYALRPTYEDIADIGAASVAYEAYIRWSSYRSSESRLPGLDYNPRQLFWIAMATRQCALRSPMSVRDLVVSRRRSVERLLVNAALASNDAFARDFGCHEGTMMNPQEKCKVY